MTGEITSHLDPKQYRGGGVVPCGRNIVGLVLLMLVADVPAAWAWKYKLDPDSRHFTAPWCERYVQNLNSFKAPPHMTCERKINPEFSEFSEPKWETLDPMAHMDVIEGILRQILEQSARNRWRKGNGYQAKLRELYPETPTVADMKAAGITTPTISEMWVKSRKAAIDAEWVIVGKARLEGMVTLFKEKKRWLGRTRFDINNDGSPDTVYRIGGRGCYRRTYNSRGEENKAPPHNPKIERDDYAWGYSVLERDNAKVAYSPYLSWPQNSHTFFYNGRTHIDGWGWGRVKDRPPSTPMKLTVYEPSFTRSRFSLAHVCPIIYYPEKKDLSSNPGVKK